MCGRGCGCGMRDVGKEEAEKGARFMARTERSASETTLGRLTDANWSVLMAWQGGCDDVPKLVHRIA